MRIKLSPIRMDDSLVVVKTRDVLIINGERFDFSPMEVGSTLPAVAIQSQWIIGAVEKTTDELVITLLFPIPKNYSPAQAFPVDLIDVPDGPVAFPKPLPEPEFETPVEVLP